MRLPHHSHHGSRADTSVFALMAGGVAWGYAAALLAESVATPWLGTALLASGLAAATGSLLLFYARFVEPSWIRVTRKTVRLPGAPGLRIAVIGDFHVGPYKRAAFVERAIERVNRLRPDLVCLVGDFLYDHHEEVEHLEPLARLRAPLGAYAVVGNHDSSGDHMPGMASRSTRDRSDDIEAFLAPLGVTFLRNRSVTVEHRGARVHVAGIDDLWMPSCNLHAALKGVPRGEPCVLLSHQPDIILDPASHRAGLVLSGHTHGGQVRFPLLGALHIPQRLNKKFDRGIFPLTPNSTLAITHGIGETIVPLRFLAHPEILLLETE